VNLVPIKDLLSTDSKKTTRKRTYDESCLDMGFTETNNGQPQYVICSKVFPNSSMYPGNVWKYSHGIHSKFVEFGPKKSTTD